MTIAHHILAAAALAGLATAAAAQDFSYGENLFMTNCAVCHGAGGAGDGPVAALFEVRPGDLTQLAAANNGAFPFSQVYKAIEGGAAVAGHGTSEMPVWGDLFRAEALPLTVHPGVEGREIVQGRILALTYYLQSIQN